MRICPNCNAQIHNPEAYFCYNCGAKLFDEKKIESLSKSQLNELIRQEKTISSLAPKKEPMGSEKTTEAKRIEVREDSLSKKWNYFVAGVNVISILFLVITLGIFFRAVNLESLDTFTPLVSINNVEIEESKVTNLEAEVLKSEYYNIVPQNVLLYLESSNLKEFLPNMLSDEEKNYIESTYEMNLEDLLIFMKPDFSFVRKNVDTWAIITRTGGVDFFERTYSKYQENKVENPPIYSSRVNEFLIFSKDEGFINEMRDVANNIELSISKDATFVNKKNSIRGTPLFFAYSSSKEYFVSKFNEDLDRLKLSDLFDSINKTDFSATFVVKEGSGYFMYTIE